MKQVGQRWAYRSSRASGKFHESVILALGTQKPQRARIELVADEWEGRRVWVPLARLEVRWDDRHDYIEIDRKIRAVRAWNPSRLERRTAEHVFIKLVPLEVAEFNADSAGTAVVYDVPALARLAGLTQDDLREPPAYLFDQELTVPWPTTERIGRAVASRHPHVLLSRIEQEERDANHNAMYGVTLTDDEGNDRHVEPADARQRFEQRQKPYLDKLREWIGVERAEDLLERRDLLVRLASVAAVATEAIDALEPTQKRLTGRLRSRLEASMDGVDLIAGE